MASIKIPLSGKHGMGKYALIDAQDLQKVTPYKWHINCGYATRSITRDGKVTNIKMHHEIIGKPPEGLVTDHVNRNKLDNRKKNLRHTTVLENNRNRDSNSGLDYYFYGGYWHVQILGKKYGRYKTEVEAIKMRDIYRLHPEKYKRMPSKLLPAGITHEHGRFAAKFYKDKKTYFLGRFTTLEDAINKREAFIASLNT